MTGKSTVFYLMSYFKRGETRVSKRAETSGDHRADLSALGPVRFFALLFVTFLILRNAWISDDAYIVFRTVDNFVRGFGLTFNIAERVQAFTCPLWTLLLSLFYVLTGEPYYTAILLQIVLSAATVYLVAFRISTSLFAAGFALLAFLSSKAFMDFSTSGLENALTHLILVSYLYCCIQAATRSGERKPLVCVSLLGAAALLNRMDLLFLIAPLQLFIVFAHGNRLKRAVVAAVCFSPFLLWMLFSLFYYGFVFPNTAYAKLNVGVTSHMMTVQGLYYLRNCLGRDPLTALTLVTAVYVGLRFGRGRERFALFAAIGILLHTAYVVRIGGDFMAGRFLSPSFVAAVALLTATLPRPQFERKLQQWGILAVFLATAVVGALAPSAVVFSEKQPALDAAGVTDERKFYLSALGLFAQSREKYIAANYLGYRGTILQRTGGSVVPAGQIGVFAFFAGPKMHIVDYMGLADPLLARLSPEIRRWAPGHFQRTIPNGYLEELDGVGRIEDPDLAAYYEHLKRIVGGELFRWERVLEIARFLRGDFDGLIDSYILRNNNIVPYTEISAFRREDGVLWNEKDNLLLMERGVGIRLPRGKWAEAMREGGLYSLSATGGDRYTLTFMNGDTTVHRTAVDLTDASSSLLTLHRGEVPKGLRNRAVDFIRIAPQHADTAALGHFRFELAPTEVRAETVREGSGQHRFTDRDFDIVLPAKRTGKTLQASLSKACAYRLEMYDDKALLWQTPLIRYAEEKNGLKHVALPPVVFNRGFDRLRVIPVSGNADGLAYLQML